MKIRPVAAVPYIFIYIFLILLVFVALFPVIYIFLSSFKTNMEIMVGGIKLLPDKWMFSNYARAWQLANFSRYTWNSLYMCAFIVAGSIVAATIQGYVFSRGTSKITKFIYGMVMASLFISVGTLSLFPQLQITQFLKIDRSLWGVILIYVFGMNVAYVFLSTSFYNQIPKEIDEAARIDGCNFFRIYRSILLPLTKPLIATIGLISFRASWSEYLMPYIFTLGDQSKWPLVVGVVSLRSMGGESAVAWDLMLAGISISIIPMMIVYLTFNRFFITGLTEGSIKG
ncbi:MAG: carbohydrate ABC transporter permease [Treponema sp.]|jgi:multiple sugar transport system permease protein|nr:carbohydrate ABC transporter permease [Treponema sp.]